MPGFSIIIPCLNEQKGMLFFLQRLQALRPQCEIIVVDGGSDDDTVQIARPLVDHLFESKPGRAIQMNMGAEKASSDCLIFLHADTFLPDDAIVQIQHACAQGYHWGRFDIRLIGQHWLLPVISCLMNFRSAQISPREIRLFLSIKPCLTVSAAILLLLLWKILRFQRV